MDYFPPKGTKYKWGSVRQSHTNPFRGAYVRGITSPQDAQLTCWEEHVDGRWLFVGVANLCRLDHTYVTKKTRAFTTEAAAIRAVEKIAAEFFKQDTPPWAAEALKARWRPPCVPGPTTLPW